MEDGALRRLYKVVNQMRAVDATLPMQTFATFLTVAMEDGLNISQIGQKVGLEQSSASRNVSMLSDWDWKKRTGLKLVEYHQDYMNLSVKTVHLTAKGQKLVDTFRDMMKT